MRTLTAMVFLAIMVFLVILVAQNQSILAQREVLVLDLAYLQVRFHPIRLDLMLVGGFVAGYILATMLGAPSRLKGAVERRKLRKEVVKSQALTVSQSASSADTEG